MKRQVSLYATLLGLSLLSAAQVSAAPIRDLLITEIMANPAEVSDSKGEWFELFNPTDQVIDLNGIRIHDDGSNSFTIDQQLPIDPHDFLVLGKNSDTSINGGIPVDYQYSNFTLGNSADEIILSLHGEEMLRLDYLSGFAVAGQSRALDLTDTSSPVYLLSDIPTPGYSTSQYSSSIHPVPVPGSFWLMLGGLALGGLIHAMTSNTKIAKRQKTVLAP